MFAEPDPGTLSMIDACLAYRLPSAQGIRGQYIATALLCSFPKPSSTRPSLLSHQDVVLLFHELGHCIHDLACKTKFGRLFGPDGTAGDFTEAPSQLLEYWFWAPGVLKTIGRHYSYLSEDYLQAWKMSNSGDGPQPPEKMPNSMLESLVASKNVNQAVFNLRQVTIGTFDMLLHGTSTPEELAEMNLPVLYNKIRREVCHLEDPSSMGAGEDWGHGFALYPHLMDGYDAGFYAYLL